MLDEVGASPKFGDFLRRVRRAAGLTQEELAERSGLSVRGISDLERGVRRTPRKDTLELLGLVLNIPDSELQAWLHQARAQTPNYGEEQHRPGTPGPLVGREREFALLVDGLARSACAAGAIFLVSGEPGVGKTRLATELTSTARAQGVLAIWGRCHEGVGAPAYWPWLQVLRTLVDVFDRNTLADCIRHGASELAQLLPELRDWRPDISESTFEGESARFRLFDTLSTFLRTLSKHRPLLIILDDLQWADRASLQFLVYLSREVTESRLLILGLYRDTGTDFDQQLAPATAEIGRQPANRHIALGGLRDHEVEAMARQVSPEDLPESVVQEVVERSGGNPFFIEEIVDHISATRERGESSDRANAHFSVPDGVRALIGQRLGAVSDECREILRTAAVIGREFDLRLLAAVCETPPGSTLDLLDEAEHARLIQSPPDISSNHRFVHDLIREAIYEDISPSGRLQIHEQVGATLEQIHRANLAPHYARVAHHYLQAGPLSGHQKAITYLVKAGHQAMAQVAYVNASEYFQSAVELSDHHGELDGESGVEVLLNLGEALRRSGDLLAARKRFQQCAEVARRHRLAQHLARAAIGVSEGIVLIGRNDDEARELLAEATRALGPHDSAIKAECMAREALASGEFGQEEISYQLRLSAQAVEIARRVDDPKTLAVALHARHRNLWREGESLPGAAISAAAEMVEAAKAAADPELEFTGTCWRMFTPLALGETLLVDRLFKDCQRLAAELRQPFYKFVVTGVTAMRAVLDGRFSEAETLAEGAWDISRQIGLAEHYPVLWRWLLLSHVLLEQDRINELQNLVTWRGEQIWASYSRQQSFSSRATLLNAQWHLKDQGGRSNADLPSFSDQAIGLLVEIEQNATRHWFSHIRYGAVHLADLIARLEDRELAVRLYPKLQPDARYVATVGGSFMCVGSVAHYSGLLATTLGRWDEAEGHFHEALLMNERINAKPFSARTRFAWAKMLLRRGNSPDRPRALALLDGAERTAVDSGMKALLREIGEVRGKHGCTGE